MRIGPFGTQVYNSQKKACAQQFAPAIEAELARFVAPGGTDSVDFEALETHLRQRALEVAAHTVQERFNADRSDCAGPFLPCPCGQPARYAGHRSKTFMTSVGELTLERPTITVPLAAKASSRATAPWAWHTPTCPRA